VRTWPGFERPLLRTLSARSGHDLDLLRPVDATAGARLAQVADHPPRVGLDLEHVPGVPEAVVAAASAFAAALTAASADDRAATAEAVRRLAAEYPVEAERLAAGTAPRDAEPAAATTPYGPPGEDAHVPADSPPEAVLRLYLPAGWFEGYDDPVESHPVFTRYLPALRSATAGEVPPVRVVADQGLRDEFVLADQADHVLAHGAAPREARLCDPAAFGVLPEHLRVAATSDDAGYWIPVERFGSHDHVARLLTLGAEEVAVRAVGSAGRERPPAGSGPAPG
jgi:hypothetical protein